MSSGTLFGLSYGQLDAFTDAIAAGKADIEAARFDKSKHASLTRTLERFVSQCEEIPRVLRLHCDAVWDLLATGALDSHQQVAQELRESFVRGKEILAGILELARLFQEIGGSLNSLEPLESAEKSVRKLEGAYFAQGGEGIEIEDAFAQIRGVTRDDWLKEVAARKAQTMR